MRSFSVFYRAPLAWGQQEQRFRKQAYGVLKLLKFIPMNLIFSLCWDFMTSN